MYAWRMRRRWLPVVAMGALAGCFDLGSLKGLYHGGGDGGSVDLGAGVDGDVPGDAGAPASGDGGGASTRECAAGSADCLAADTPRRCVDGHWQTQPACSGATPLCAAGACAATCQDGQRDCLGATPRVCGSGSWHALSACSGNTPVCAAGSCVACVEGRIACATNNGNDPVTPLLCSGGSWQSLGQCSGATPRCFQGSCVECTPGRDGCADKGVPAHCGPSGTWQRMALCDAATPQCSAGACQACPAGYGDCNHDTSDGCEARVSTCYQDTDGDGYGPAGVAPMTVCSTTCPAGWIKSLRSSTPDCDDNNADAHPGQLAWFGTAMASGSFDYDCDGQVTHQYPSQAVSCSQSSIGWEASMPPGCGKSDTLWQYYAYTDVDGHYQCGIHSMDAVDKCH